MPFAAKVCQVRRRCRGGRFGTARRWSPRSVLTLKFVELIIGPHLPTVRDGSLVKRRKRLSPPSRSG